MAPLPRLILTVNFKKTLRHCRRLGYQSPGVQVSAVGRMARQAGAEAPEGGDLHAHAVFLSDKQNLEAQPLRT